MTVRIEDIRQEDKKRVGAEFRAGQSVRVHRKIREGDKERVQIFDGLVIQVRNQGSLSATITVRKIVGGIGVEQVFPIHSPLIEKIELVKEAKVRRGKLYFMRNLRGKAARLKERFFTEQELKEMQPHEITEEELAEAVEHEKETETASATTDAAKTEETSAQPAEESDAEDKVALASDESDAVEAESPKAEEESEEESKKA